MTDTELDALIDDTAREMSAGAPRDAFTTSVLARLETERRLIWRSPWMVAPLAAAAVVVIAIVVTRDRGRETRAPVSTRVAQHTTSPAHDVQLGRPASPVTAVAQTGTAVRPGTRRPAAAPALVSDIEPLVAAAITIAPLEAAPLEPVDSIQAEPLPIPESIAVAPLDGEGPSTSRRFE